MSQILNNNLLTKVYQKVRSLARQCIIEVQLLKKQQTSDVIVSTILKVIQDIRKYILNICRIQDDYDKLQKLIQKYQQDIRKHIALQQQLKLYGDSIQQQLEDSELTRKSFLENTKKIISDLKRQNQKLYEQNRSFKQDQKTKGKVTLNFLKSQSSSKKKKKPEVSIEDFRKPLKTQYIQMDQTQTIKVKLQLHKGDRSIHNFQASKKKQSSAKKDLRKQGKIRTQTKSYLSFNDIYYIGKQNSRTIDPDQKRKTQKLVRQAIRSEVKQKHYKSQQSNIGNQFESKIKKIQV